MLAPRSETAQDGVAMIVALVVERELQHRLRGDEGGQLRLFRGFRPESVHAAPGRKPQPRDKALPLDPSRREDERVSDREEVGLPLEAVPGEDRRESQLAQETPVDGHLGLSGRDEPGEQVETRVRRRLDRLGEESGVCRIDETGAGGNRGDHEHAHAESVERARQGVPLRDRKIGAHPLPQAEEIARVRIGAPPDTEEVRSAHEDGPHGLRPGQGTPGGRPEGSKGSTVSFEATGYAQ